MPSVARAVVFERDGKMEEASNCGFWDLRSNNVTGAADFATYHITWTSGGTVDATDWKTTATFPRTLTYTYEPVSPAFGHS